MIEHISVTPMWGLFGLISAAWAAEAGVQFMRQFFVRP